MEKIYMQDIYQSVKNIFFSKSCIFKIYFIHFIYIYQNISDIYLKYT